MRINYPKFPPPVTSNPILEPPDGTIAARSRPLGGAASVRPPACVGIHQSGTNLGQNANFSCRVGANDQY